MSASDFYSNGELNDYYSILQIARKAEPEVISFAYKALAKKNHPDMGGTAEKMKLLNEAHDVLKDPVLKSEYDKLYDAEQEANEQVRVQPRSDYADTPPSYSSETRADYSGQAETSSYEGYVNTPEDSGLSLTEYLLRKTERENLSDNVYEVLVRGYNFFLPAMCVCCLEVPQRKLKVRYAFNEGGILSRTDNSFSIYFPICRACKKHIREFAVKRTLFIILSLLIGTASAVWLVGKVPQITWGELMIVGSAVTTISAFIFNALIKLSVIKDCHASRGPAVEILSCNEWGTKFWFNSWLYAEMFAEDNGSEAVPIVHEKYGRDRSLLKGRFAMSTFAVIVMVMAAIVTIISILLTPMKGLWD